MPITFVQAGIDTAADVKGKFIVGARALHTVVASARREVEARLDAFTHLLYGTGDDVDLGKLAHAEPVLLAQIDQIITTMTLTSIRYVDLYMQLMYSQVRATTLDALREVYPFEIFVSEELEIPDLRGTEVALPVQEAVGTHAIKVGAGVEREYQRYLRKTFRLRHLPEEVTRGLGKRLSRGLGTRVVWASKKAQGGEYVKAGLARELKKVSADFSDFERRLDLTLRDGMHWAATDSVSVFAANNPSVTGLVRIASGNNPCLVCQLLHGTVYPPGASLRDHRYGLCSFALRMLTPEEMGITDPTGRLAEATERLNAEPKDILKEKFWNASDHEKENLFPSKAVFAEWKRKPFPLTDLITYNSSWQGWQMKTSNVILRQQERKRR